MPKQAWRVTVTGTPVVIVGIAAHNCYVRNASNELLFLGGPGVTSTTGFQVSGNTTHGPMDVGPGYELWGVRVAGKSGAVHCLTD